MLGMFPGPLHFFSGLILTREYDSFQCVLIPFSKSSNLRVVWGNPCKFSCVFYKKCTKWQDKTPISWEDEIRRKQGREMSWNKEQGRYPNCML